MTQSELWFGGGHWLEPPRRYRSWPHPRDRLERLAYAAGLDDDGLRKLLQRTIEQRRAATPADADLPELVLGAGLSLDSQRPSP